MALDASQFIEHLGLTLEADRLPRIAGRLLGALILAPDRESLDDLAARLAVSKPSISVNARLLEQKRLIERVTIPGDRRDFYRVAPDLFRAAIEQRLARWRAFHDAMRAARVGKPSDDPVVQARIAALEAGWGHAVAAVTSALDEWDRQDRPAINDATADLP